MRIGGRTMAGVYLRDHEVSHIILRNMLKISLELYEHGLFTLNDNLHFEQLRSNPFEDAG
jgi:hypothetical protein